MTRKLIRSFYAFLCFLAIAAFSLAPSAPAQTEQVLTSFTSQPQGAYPAAGLIADSAGNLYGTNTGETEFLERAGGAVFKLTPNGAGGWTESTIHHFGDGYTSTDGSIPYGSVILDSQGNLYGTTEYGGLYYCGVVYELSPVGETWQEKILYNFVCVEGAPVTTDGAHPMGSLLLDAQGDLYGTANEGGLGGCSDYFGDYYGCGIVFELSPSSGAWTETILYNFDTHSPHIDGANPTSNLIFDSAGNLYGTTPYGGVGNYGYGNGTVFELQPGPDGSWSESVLYRFSGLMDGGLPLAGVIFDSAGNLYGTTAGNGDTTSAAFKLTPAGNGNWIESTIYQFSNNLAGPAGGLVIDSDGNLFGTAEYSGSTGPLADRSVPPKITYKGKGGIFELSPNSSGGYTESVLYSFTGGTDGANPLAALLRDRSGNLYTTTYCINNACGPVGGSVFELSPSAGDWSPNTLYDFALTSDALDPSGSLIRDSAGNLYGVTAGGGKYFGQFCQNSGCGTVFEISPTANGAWTTHVLYNFTGNADGANPMESLVMDSSGNLYGAAQYGGVNESGCLGAYDTNPCGTVFKLSPNSGGTWTFSVLHSFVGYDGETNDGANPATGLLLDPAGNLYGETSTGGPYQQGTVYELSPTSDGSYTEQVIDSFRYSDEESPFGTPVMDKRGNLYGTTPEMVFRLSPSQTGWAETALFKPRFGTYGVVLDAAGNLYGALDFGGDHDSGSVYELSPTSSGLWKETTIYSFRNQVVDGYDPQSALTFDSTGNLYGTTSQGGTANGGCYQGCGTVFKLTPSSGGLWSETVVHRFSAEGDGAVPTAGVVFDSAGNLYGTTFYGGSTNQGAVYRVTP